MISFQTTKFITTKLKSTGKCAFEKFTTELPVNVEMPEEMLKFIPVKSGKACSKDWTKI